MESAEQRVCIRTFGVSQRRDNPDSAGGRGSSTVMWQLPVNSFIFWLAEAAMETMEDRLFADRGLANAALRVDLIVDRASPWAHRFGRPSHRCRSGTLAAAGA